MKVFPTSTFLSPFLPLRRMQNEVVADIKIEVIKTINFLQFSFALTRMIFRLKQLNDRRIVSFESKSKPTISRLLQASTKLCIILATWFNLRSLSKREFAQEISVEALASVVAWNLEKTRVREKFKGMATYQMQKILLWAPSWSTQYVLSFYKNLVNVLEWNEWMA